MRRVYLFFFFIFSLFPLFARDVEITVIDTELELPLEGAVIRSWDGKQYVCDENGRALISVPDERQVVVQAAYPGYENGRLVVAPAGAAGDTGAYTLSLRLSGVMEGRELVVEAARPGSSETRTGRSVAISGRDLSQTAEIGVVEDIMTTVKLLPGVGYAGLFNTHPSIRGGFPGDMSASLDGFYIFNPYHWGGSFSIFDPRMVESAQLSHGVFSTRYGHTTAGLLDITSKSPSPTDTEFELSASTSTANFSVSFPFSGRSSANRGGIMAMGRVTYYDPIVALAKQLSKVIDIEELQAVNAIQTSPYIRSGVLTGNYRFADDLDFKATAFWGMDGVGIKFDPDAARGIPSRTRSFFNYTNYQGFVTGSLSWNPRSDMLLKFSTGAGYRDEVVEANNQNSIGERPFSENFKTKYSDLQWYFDNNETYDFFRTSFNNQSGLMINAQGRLDYDWELDNGFLVAAGAQEMFSRYRASGEREWLAEMSFYDALEKEEQQQALKDLFPMNDATWDDLNIIFPTSRFPGAKNIMLTTSGYGLGEYTTPNNRFGAELGLRVDHFALLGDGFSLQSKPALNPRFNMDFNIFKNKGARNKFRLESLDISAGTGLFTSMNDNIFGAEKQYNIQTLRPSRAWTSVLGTKLGFPESLSLNVEGYYKYIYDRMYIPTDVNLETNNRHPQFDGEGHVWGIDTMLQKTQSRYWDGWIVYSFSWAKYRDPGRENNDWYFPSFHRYHNLNLIFNIKPTSRINIYTRFGAASGVQLSRRITERPESYPALVYDPDNPLSNSYFIEKYRWPSEPDESNRTTWSLPMDIKISIFGKRKNGKTRYELYFAIENVLSLLYSAQGNESFNSYTGEVDTGSATARYEIPFPVPSFGFKVNY